MRIRSFKDDIEALLLLHQIHSTIESQPPLLFDLYLCIYSTKQTQRNGAVSMDKLYSRCG